MTEATLLVVDDDPQILDLYKQYLSEDYTVRQAIDGESALERLGETVDVVLLDRRMPDRSGDEFLSHIRKRGYDCPVGMVTAIEPAVDILDLGFDDYIVKPVTREELIELVASLLRRVTYERHIQDWLAMLSKKAALEHRMTEEELEDRPEYWALLREIEELDERANVELEDLSPDEFDQLFQRIPSQTA